MNKNWNKKATLENFIIDDKIKGEIIIKIVVNWHGNILNSVREFILGQILFKISDLPLMIWRKIKTVLTIFILI